VSDRIRYDNRTILLHWLSAAGIAVMWLLEQGIGLVPRPQHYIVLSTHIVLGLALIVLFCVRFQWRMLGGGGRKLPAADPGALGKAATGVHHLLYLLVFAVLALGLVVESTRGDTLYNLVALPQLFEVDRPLRRTLTGYHELAANALIILAACHAAAALFHHVVKKDGVLLRMR
jgi:cytochrome b561